MSMSNVPQAGWGRPAMAEPAEWWWQCHDDGGADVTPESWSSERPEFPSQADAESWLGEEWAALADEGVAAVTLHHLDQVVYGPMPLEA